MPVFLIILIVILQYIGLRCIKSHLKSRNLENWKIKWAGSKDDATENTYFHEAIIIKKTLFALFIVFIYEKPGE